MDTPSNIRRVDHEPFFDFYHPHGELNTIYRRAVGNYTIACFDVEGEFRRQGIGKSMLEAARNHARQVSAERIVAAIISRECLEAMRSVFGPNYVTVEEEGTYHPVELFGEPTQGNTKAVLFFPLGE